MKGGPLRNAVFQGLSLAIAAGVFWWLARNTAESLEQRGISLGVGFLLNPANFDISDTPLRYNPADSFARAILVGLVNTARVSALGWVLSIALGFALGILRLAHNPAIRGLTRAIVETLRSTPLLLLLLLLAATVYTLPPPAAALEPLPGLFVSDRGLVVAFPAFRDLHLWLMAGLGATLLARRHLGASGWPAVFAVAIAFGIAMAVWPPEWRAPVLRGFNFSGGLSISPELAALLAALVLHHAAHISETVRGAILAVPRTQRDAAAALGLSRGQVLRFVVVPQALRAMVPVLASNCVSLTKNSSLAVAIGFPDLVSVLNTTANQTGHAIEAMLIMIVVYLALSLAVAAAMNTYNARVLHPRA
jgi:general L-amino acid transport system permease protein